MLVFRKIWLNCLSIRYRAIVKPLDIQTSSTTTTIVLRAALIWVFSLVLAIPEAVYSDLHTFNITSTNESFVTCAPYPHAGELHPKIHSMASFLIFYVIPLLVISVYYTFIAQSLMKSASNLPVEGNVYARQQAGVKPCFRLVRPELVEIVVQSQKTRFVINISAKVKKNLNIPPSLAEIWINIFFMFVQLNAIVSAG